MRQGLNRLPDRQRKRSIPTIRYEKQVPGHHVQVDVKFLDLKTEDGHKVRYFQYTAIDDATRIRALKIYKKHTQQNAIDFVDYVIAKFPFRINTIRTDNVLNQKSRLLFGQSIPDWQVASFKNNSVPSGFRNDRMFSHHSDTRSQLDGPSLCLKQS